MSYLSKTFLSQKGKLHYLDIGNGPCLVLLHGLLENVSIWKPFISHFARNYRVIAIDLPGHGRSEVFGENHRMMEMAASVWELLEALAIDTIQVVGHSMGGYVSIELAELKPDKVTQVCLFHSHCAADSATKKLNRDRTVKVFEQNAKRCIKEVIPSLVASAQKNLKQAEVNQLIHEASHTPVAGICACLRGMRDRESKETWLKHTDCSILFLAGTEDPVMPIAKLKEQAKHGKNVSFHALEAVGHLGFIEAPDSCLQALDAWLD